MTEFTSSGGFRFERTEDQVHLHSPQGTKYIGGGAGRVGRAVAEYADHQAANALAKRDEDLGRWRYNDHIVVYKNPHGEARVVREDNGSVSEHSRRSASVARPAIPETILAARAYFAAHPEPKPWHAAKEGEVWMLTVSEWGTRTDPFYVGLRTEGLQIEPHPVFEPITPAYPISFMGLKATVITAGERLFPREAK